VFPPREPEVELDRRDDESHEVDVIHRVRLLRRQVGSVTVRAHEGEHDEIRLQREAVLLLERGGDARVDCHPEQ
jgi:hypothetical protein